MARTASEVIKSIADESNSIDPSLDTKQGPIYNYMIQPIGNEVAGRESEQERIAQLNSLEFVSAATDTEVEAVATNWGLSRGAGTFSKVRLFFMRFTRPTSDDLITLNIGTLISTLDGKYTYRTTEQGTLDGSKADQYYNAGRKTYEIPIQAEAVAVGSDYDLPSYRIIRIMTPISGIDAVENREAASGGSSSETSASLVNRIYKKFAGTDKGSTGGLISDIENNFPESVNDVSIVKPKDRSLFKRYYNGPALDIYVIGEIQLNFVQTYTATGGETEIALDYKPVISIDYVRVNLVGTSFTLVQETGLINAGSTRANDKIVLSTALVANDQVEIHGIYNSLISDIQDLYSDTNQRLFETDILIKKYIEVPLKIEINAKIISSKVAEKAQEEIATQLLNSIETNKFVEAHFPEKIRENIMSSVSGLSSLSFVFFTKESGSYSDVEVIEMATNEYAKVDLNVLRINISK